MKVGIKIPFFFIYNLCRFSDDPGVGHVILFLENESQNKGFYINVIDNFVFEIRRTTQKSVVFVGFVTIIYYLYLQ